MAKAINSDVIIFNIPYNDDRTFFWDALNNDRYNIDKFGTVIAHRTNGYVMLKSRSDRKIYLKEGMKSIQDHFDLFELPVRMTMERPHVLFPRMFCQDEDDYQIKGELDRSFIRNALELSDPRTLSDMVLKAMSRAWQNAEKTKLPSHIEDKIRSKLCLFENEIKKGIRVWKEEDV